MPELFGSSLAGIAVAVAGVLVAALLVARYRSLVRRGTPLPPGAGGARLRGLEVTVRSAHVPGGAPGVVHVLGDDWSIADEVMTALPVGTRVRVVAVVGTRLVVEPVDAEPLAAVRQDEPDPDAGASDDPLADDRPSDPARPDTGSST